MEQDKKAYSAAKRFSAPGTEIEYKCTYKKCIAYYEFDKNDEGSCIGYPSFILVDSNYICRYATPDEALDII